MAANNIMKILLIDNYDSFSYNLYQYIGKVCRNKWGEAAAALSNKRIVTGDGYEIRTIRNDEMTVRTIEEYKPGAIVISPGPGRPADAGVCEEVIQKMAGKVPILGVCLGHQAICEAFGGTITYAERLMHGKSSEVTLDTNCPVFKGLDRRQSVARYHSLAVEKTSLPDCLTVTAETDDGQIMAVSHKEYALFGLQFHPESILTPSGEKMIENFLNLQ